MNYVSSFSRGVLRITDGWAPVHDCGTGFLMIQRDVVQVMQRAYAHLAGYSGTYTTSASKMDPNDNQIRTLPLHYLFDTGIEVGTGRYLSEDYVFLQRWKALGGETLADLRSTLAHTGTYTFQGDSAQGVWDPVNHTIRNAYRIAP